MKKIILLFILLTLSYFTFQYFYLQKEKVNIFNTKYKEQIKEINFTIVGDLLFEEPFYTAINNGYNQNEGGK